MTDDEAYADIRIETLMRLASTIMQTERQTREWTARAATLGFRGWRYFPTRHAFQIISSKPMHRSVIEEGHALNVKSYRLASELEAVGIEWHVYLPWIPRRKDYV